MFCAKCGDEADGVWLCRRGNMPLSLHLTEQLLDIYLRTVRDSTPKPRLSWGGNWWCPGCGSRLSEVDGLVECEQCGHPLNEFLRELVELHPHLTDRGLWR
jgi:hypothetical protein